MTVRAKFQCTKITNHLWNDAKTYTFEPRYDTSIPEDQRYAKATPSGHLEMLVDNPAVSFELGAYYYLDLTKVDEQ